MMKQNDRVLKPIINEVTGENERRFYEELNLSSDPALKEMTQFVPAYHGVKQILVNGKLLDCLVLDDVTAGMKEPCVIDLKIGRRTWDPLATPFKIQNEKVGLSVSSVFIFSLSIEYRHPTFVHSTFVQFLISHI